ncbi:hypothetical protein FACS1894132_10110 [Clostridia bacterium]|nr:hypothetical protein FACS1894132_10110 [Clostridia bacterium]
MKYRRIKIPKRGKLFRRLFATITSVAMTLTICGSFALPASAVPITIKVGDIDNDGMVGKIADVVLLGKHFSGQAYMQIDVVDVNHDGVATRDDLDMLISYLTSSITSFPDTNASGYRTIDDITAKNNGTRTYLKHDYSNNTTTSYDLTTSTMGLAGWDGTSPDNINLQPLNTILPDNRAGYLNDAIVKIQISTGTGTGFIIGENLVATAAHCLYGVNYINWFPNISIKTSDDSVYYASFAHIPQEYLTIKSTRDPSFAVHDELYIYDYAILEIDTEVDLAETYGALSFGAITDTAINTISGLSSAAPKHIALAGHSLFNGSTSLHIAWGNLKNHSNFVDDLDSAVYFNIIDIGGDSGGPIIYDVDGNPSTTFDQTVIAINTLTGGWSETEYAWGAGARVTSQLIKFYYHNANIEGA